MPRNHRRPRHRFDRPLSVARGERSTALQLPTPTYTLPRLIPAAPKPARDVLAVLLASAGLTLAGRRDARVEMLPGTPVTIVISVGGRARAALVLPVAEAEARKLIGDPAPDQRDDVLEILWEEERADEFLLPDAALDERRQNAWEPRYAC